jgi:hypothetical protein
MDEPAAEGEKADDPPLLAADDCVGGSETALPVMCPLGTPPLCLSRCY